MTPAMIDRIGLCAGKGLSDFPLWSRTAMSLRPTRWTTGCSLMFCIFFGCFLLTRRLQAQETNPPKQPLVETDKTLMNESPFDLVILKREAGGEQAKVLPIDFPNRSVPSNPDPNSKLVVSLVRHPDRKYEVRWKDIEKIVLFEEQVLNDAKRLMQEKDYAAAFEHLNYLLTFYPQTVGLDRMKEDFLFTSAAEMFAQQRLHHTLAVLEELQRTYPNSRTKQVRTGISNVAEQLMLQYVQGEDWRAAQAMLARLKADYASQPLDVVGRWEEELRKRADDFGLKAEQLFTAGKLKEARDSANRMLTILPNAPGGKELLAKIVKAYPMVRVGVFQASKSPNPSSLTDWAARRSGQLVSQPLVQFRDTGPEGGEYRFALGNFHQSDDRQELELLFSPKENSAYSSDVAQWLLRRADPHSEDYLASWAAIVKEVRLESPERILIRFRKPHVLPHAFLQWPLEEAPTATSQLRRGTYRREDPKELEANYLLATTGKNETNRPVEIVERFYEDPRQAVNDLLRGDLDAIDQLYPADAKLLSGTSGIKVERYSLPTVHMLVPRSNHRYLREATFRRALMYGINRESVLRDEILGGNEIPGCRVISGPFPAGMADNDPLSYAYNTSVEPMHYDRTLAKLLLIMTEKDLATSAAKKKTTPPELERIRLGVPNVEFAKTAGEAFIQQWAILGIPAELVVLPPGENHANSDKIDLLYLTAAIWEPATDAERLFGADGVAATNDPFIVQALGTLRLARNWTEVRQSLHDLHKLVDDHLPVLPLWQVTDAMAYRTHLRGITPRSLTLYQGLDQWRLTEEKP